MFRVGERRDNAKTRATLQQDDAGLLLGISQRGCTQQNHARERQVLQFPLVRQL
jgi:hypothetical protein